VSGGRDGHRCASGEDGAHLGSGQNAPQRECSARRDLSAAILVILVASLAVFGWRSYEDGLNAFLDSICCGQVIAFPVFESGITPHTLAADDATQGLARLWPFSQRNDSYAYLAEWSEEDRARLSLWLDLGIRFEGEWQSDELMLTLDVLDAFGRVYGAERFASIVRQTVRARSQGWRNYLTVVRLQGAGHPAAAWAPAAGMVLFNDSMFDEDYVTQYYNWRLLHEGRPETVMFSDLQEIVIAHEFGHAIIDGLRLEATQEGSGILSVEGLYTRYVPADQWPHYAAPTNENLATELGAWALEIERTPQVEEFQAQVLEQTSLDETWSDRVLNTRPLPAVSR
jgi:hypothetical protein